MYCVSLGVGVITRVSDIKCIESCEPDPVYCSRTRQCLTTGGRCECVSRFKQNLRYLQLHIQKPLSDQQSIVCEPSHTVSLATDEDVPETFCLFLS